MKNFAYIRAQSIPEAIKLSSSNAEATYIAGGTNLIDRLKVFVEQPPQVIDISRLGLKKIEKTTTGWQIGALVSNTDLADHPDIRKDYPLLSRAILAGASQQIRNMATVGGNLLQRTRCAYYYDTAFACNKRQPGSGCPAIAGIHKNHAIFGASNQCVAVHPSDMAVALVALDAMIEVQGKNGKRQLPIGELHRLPASNPELDTTLKPGELITSIILPPLPMAKSGVYLKLRDRSSYSFALVSVATALEVVEGEIRQARLVMGGVAHKPWRFTEVEKFLMQKPATAETFQQAAKLALKDAQPLAGNQFKVEMSKRAIRRALTISAQGGGIA